MTNFRDRAREVKKAGENERGNFTPHGVPKRMHTYWLENSDSKKARRIRYGTQKENFCHFWRVVLIWTPLLWMKSLATKIATSLPFLIVLALGVVAGVVALFVYVDDFWQVPLYVLGMGIALALVGLTLTGLDWLHSRYWKKSWNRYVYGAILIVIILLGVASVSYALYAWARETSVLTVVVSLALFALAALGGGYAILWMSDYLKGKRALAEEERKTRWDAFMRGDIGYDEYYDGPRRAPGRISKFFSGVGDFIVLISQVVRVKKWKICPLVEVDVDDGVRN